VSYVHPNLSMCRDDATDSKGRKAPPPLGGRGSAERACVFNALFKATPLLEDAIMQARK
jgi:hypothetical protein